MLHSRLLAIGICLLLQQANAQVGIGVTPPDGSAQFHVQSTTKGMLVPRMTATQMNAISSPANGLLVYQTDGTPGFYYYNGSAWVLISNNLTVKNGGSNFTNSLLIGHQTTGTLNNAIGNLGVGSGTLRSLTGGYDNVAIGLEALYSNTTGSFNLALGRDALRSLTTGGENIGIGESTLSLNSTGYYNLAIGLNSLLQSTGNENTGLGWKSLENTTTGGQNTAVGSFAGNYITSGSNNIVIGRNAQTSDAAVSNEVTIGNSSNDSYRMFGRVGIGVTVATPVADASAQLDVQSTTKGMLVPRMTEAQKLAVGSPANGLLVYQTDGTSGFYFYNGSSWNSVSPNLTVKNGGSNFTNSLLIGHQTTGTLVDSDPAQSNLGIGNGETMKSLTTGDNNIAIGNSSLNNTTSGVGNIGLGTATLVNNVSGSYNVGIGIDALQNTTANDNIGIGRRTLLQNTSGDANIAIGSLASQNSTTALQNIAIGAESLFSNISSSDNTAIGHNALFNSTGGQNTALGANAGQNITTGTNNIVIGRSASASSATVSNEVTIGNSSNDSYRMFGNLSFTGMTNNGKTVLSNQTITNAALNNRDVSNVSILFVEAGGVGNDVYGLSGGVAGQVIHIFTKDATLYFHHNGSAGTQKFALQATIVINPNDGVTLVFDGTYWRMTRNFMAPPA